MLRYFVIYIFVCLTYSGVRDQRALEIDGVFQWKSKRIKGLMSIPTSSNRNPFLSSSYLAESEIKNLGDNAGVLPYARGSDNVLSDITNQSCITTTPISSKKTSGNFQSEFLCYMAYSEVVIRCIKLIYG